MVKVGNTLNVQSASTSRIVVGADEIDLATTGVSAGTYRSVTVDTYGRVSAGTNPTTLAGYGITDAYTSTATDSLLAGKLSLTGGTMSGALAMGTSKITGLGDPTNAQDAATKNYTDTGLAAKLSLSGGTMTGALAMGTNRITGMGDPVNAQDGATKNYIDTIFGSTASAAASAAAAASSATSAQNSANSASSSASSASSSASTASTALFNFRAQYLGPLASDPTVDGNGNPVSAGDLYFNTVANEVRVYNGSAWVAAYVPTAGFAALASANVFTANQTITANTSSDALKITQTGSGNALYIEDVASDATPFVVSSTGVMGIGTTTPDNVTSAGIALVSNSGFYPQLVQRNTTADGNASYVVLEKNRDGAVVQNGDVLGNLVFRGFDGTNYLQGAFINAVVSAAPGTNDMPADLIVGTTPDGASGPSERLRVTQAGNVGIGTSSPGQRLDVVGAVRAQAAATQDGVVLQGRAGGTSSFAATITPATLSANRTVTLPDENFTVGFRNLPAVGTKTGSYTLAVGDVGKYVQLGSGGSITIPTSTFAEGDAITLYNNTTGNITITCSAPTAYIAGTNTVKTSMTLATRGVATILFYSATACVVSGNVS
jgi:hypothetical protein